ncbi:hypothetical protein JHS3_27850 [Jeongeupia sp. HS-3]|nr:hypothetical protein [Jeongeupia sp. HS-3]BCL77049.1 hypothetical protein JHS3_27850 [Jeongeupia sp. HS-3]
MATVLADMVPEKRNALIAERLFLDADFQNEYAPARAELRAALGL